MSRLWHRLKNNVLYYYSVVDVLVSGFLFHFIHFLKTGKFPQKRARYSQDEILEEIRKIAQELLTKKRLRLRARSLESRICRARPAESRVSWRRPLLW